MGFIYQTNGQILTFEGRRESAIMSDGDEDGKSFLFFNRVRENVVKETIQKRIMQLAGNAFAEGNETEADRLKAAAQIVKNILIVDTAPASVFEASYKWLGALLKFLDAPDQAKLKAEILSFTD